MRLSFYLLSLCAVVWSCTNCNGRYFLGSPRDTGAGVWHPMQHCYSGMFARGMQIEYERNQGTKDDSALNVVRLYCSQLNDYSCSASFPISSGVGAEGGWQDAKWCPSSQAIIGFGFRQTNEMKPDNLALVNYRAICGYPFGHRVSSHFLEGNTDAWGAWIQNQWCPVGYVVCGTQSRIAAFNPHPKGDNYGMTNIQADCCQVKDIQCTPGYQIVVLAKFDNSHGKRVTTVSYDVKTSFTMTSENRRPINAEKEIINRKLSAAADHLVYSINAEIGHRSDPVTASSIRAMLQDAMTHESAIMMRERMTVKYS